MDVTHTALPLLAAALTPGVPAVLAMPFTVEAARHKGVIICSGTGPVQTMLGPVGKPSRPRAEQLARAYGAGALRLLLGRMRITPDLLGHLLTAGQGTVGEPKLSPAVAAYASNHLVHIVTTTQPMTDLGTADVEQ